MNLAIAVGTKFTHEIEQVNCQDWQVHCYISEGWWSCKPLDPSLLYLVSFHKTTIKEALK
jgi:hypothetical protein